MISKSLLVSVMTYFVGIITIRLTDDLISWHDNSFTIRLSYDLVSWHDNDLTIIHNINCWDGKDLTIRHSYDLISLNDNGITIRLSDEQISWHYNNLLDFVVIYLVDMIMASLSNIVTT